MELVYKTAVKIFKKWSQLVKMNLTAVKREKLVRFIMRQKKIISKGGELSVWSPKIFYLQKKRKKLAKLGRFIKRLRECFY